MDIFINPIISASKHAADLTGKLLLFARNSNPQVEDVNINALVLNVVHLLEHTVDKRISIHHSFHPQTPAVHGDVKQIQSAILNIAMNACEALPEGGKLLFETSVSACDAAFRKTHARAKDAANFVCISVVDTGKGMDKETRARMFEPFFTTKTDGSSVGMGLTSVSNCVKNHGGFVEVESAPGKGTRVEAYLPLARFQPAADAGAVPSGKSIRGSGCILVIDDEPSFLGISKAILRDLGYSVVTCPNGWEAVDYYRKNHGDVDLAIIDLMMPELSGCDCFRELKKINPAVRAIISTGYGRNSEVEAALKEGVCDFIQKPFESARLSQVLSGILAKK
jgi:CheY-like chemotaxis protein